MPYRTLLLLLALGATASAAPPPEDFPRFFVPGKEQAMESVRVMYWLHYEHSRPLVTLWDQWMAMSTLWPARGEGTELNAMRTKWAAALTGRGMTAEGYVHTHQHNGPAHAEGWPFPRWQDGGGVGWHFISTGVAGYDPPRATPEGWTLAGATGGEVGQHGWRLALDKPSATAKTPPITLDARLAPWLRLNWRATGLDGAACFVEWTTADEPEFSPARRIEFQPPPDSGSALGDAPVTRTMIPAYRHPRWRGVVTSLRIGFANEAAATVVIDSLHTAFDTRHNVNNLSFIRGCHDYFLWTRDVPFLAEQIGRLRRAMRFVEEEFQTRERRLVYTTWPGHEGRSGVRWVGGEKRIVPGEGVGSNYWDLLPFGGEDALATVYYYGALNDLAELEEAIAAHPEWPAEQLADDANADAYDLQDLRQQAEWVRGRFQTRFWNSATGRFGTRDLEGRLYDYGFTFLNNEAVCYGLASPQQARSIHRWISGQRRVRGDTSWGEDIYHWRFGPRSTTRRNLDYYVWNWTEPENVPWGDQVQDGGAVLGWSFHDLMARLQTADPDDAAQRLEEIAAWFDDVQQAGGYRAYYTADAARGNLQGGNVAGGLGLDKEFHESILVPQVMLYGFLGFLPTVEGCTINPRLPRDWPELTVTRIHLHDCVLAVTATQDGSVVVKAEGPTGAAAGASSVEVRVGEQHAVVSAGGAEVRFEAGRSAK